MGIQLVAKSNVLINNLTTLTNYCLQSYDYVQYDIFRVTHTVRTREKSECETRVLLLTRGPRFSRILSTYYMNENIKNCPQNRF